MWSAGLGGEGLEQGGCSGDPFLCAKQAWPLPCFSSDHSPSSSSPLSPASGLMEGAGGWQFLSPENSHRKFEIISLLCWQLRKWQIFYFYPRVSPYWTKRPHMPLSSRGGRAEGECRSARGQFTVLAKRRGLLWSCSGRGWAWEEEVTNQTLADMQQGQAEGGQSNR